MKNVIQSVKFPVIMLSTRKIPSELDAAISEFNSPTSPDTTEDKLQKVIDNTPEDLAAEIKNLGAETAKDFVSLNISISSLCFDIFTHVEKIPQAPIAQLQYKKKCQTIADLLDDEEFEIPDFARRPIRKCLEDDTLWSSLGASAWINKEVEGEIEKHFTPINSRGINFFTEVTNALAGAFIEDDQKEAKKKEESTTEDGSAKLKAVSSKK